MTRHITKGFRGFKLVPKQDGSGKVTVEKIPMFGLDASAKIKQRKSKRVRVAKPGFDTKFGRGK